MHGKPYQDTVAAFATLGASIINLDRNTRYEQIGALSKRPLEPGYIPVARPARIVNVSYYPNESEMDTDAYRSLQATFFRWAIEGTAEAYEASYADWLAALPAFPFHRDFVRPLFDEIGVADSEFAWLPLIKAPLPARSTVPDDDIFSDRILLWDQLSLLKPAIILAQGMAAADVVRPMCEDKFPHRLVLQKIGRFGTKAAKKVEHERVIAELREALGQTES